MSAVNETNRLNVLRSSKSDIRNKQQNNSNFFPFIIFSFARFQFFLLIEVRQVFNSAEEHFRLTVNPWKVQGSLWIWLWKFSYRQLSTGDGFASRLFRSKISVLISECDPFVYVECELRSHLCHKVRRIWVLHSHAENPQSMRWNVSQSKFRSLSPVSWRWVTISSVLQRGSGQLVGQRVPALHLLALILQTVYPVLQSVSLWVTP